MKTAVIYYSYGGNTENVAKRIAELCSGDSFEIKTVKPYKGSYSDVVNQGQEEVESGFMPEIKALDIDFSLYDKVVICTPVWWYTMAPAMRSFLSKISIGNKSLYLVATNGGWLGHTFKDMEKLLNAKSKASLDIPFNGTHMRLPDERIIEWAEGIK